VEAKGNPSIGNTGRPRLKPACHTLLQDKRMYARRTGQVLSPGHKLGARRVNPVIG
jgi:hypothetical protein